MARPFHKGGSTFGHVMRRSVSTRAKRRWQGFQQSVALVGLTQFAGTIVAPNAYAQGTMESRTTFGGGIISFSYRMDAAQAPGQGAWAVYVLDNEETIPGSIVTTSLTQDDVLAAGTFAASVESPFTLMHRIRSKRKLENDRIIFAINSKVATNGVLDVICRFLLIGG